MSTAYRYAGLGMKDQRDSEITEQTFNVIDTVYVSCFRYVYVYYSLEVHLGSIR